MGADVVERVGNTMTLSLGPQHPSTHGVLQVVVEISGETIERAEMEIGYLHTGIEKSAENLFWTQAQTVIERMDYLNPIGNSLCYVLAAEQLLGVTDRIPPRAQAIRVLMTELTRISSHCVWLGTHGIDLGAIFGSSTMIGPGVSSRLRVCATMRIAWSISSRRTRNRA